MKELYEARNKLDITELKRQVIIDSDEVKLKFIDDLTVILDNNEHEYNLLKKQASDLKKEIKILELVYFCQNGSYPDE